MHSIVGSENCLKNLHFDDISDPELPHGRKVPKHFQVGTGEGSHLERVQDYYRHVYFESLDLTINCIEIYAAILKPARSLSNSDKPVRLQCHIVFGKEYSGTSLNGPSQERTVSI